MFVIIGRTVCGIVAAVLGVFIALSFTPGLRKKFLFLRWPDGTGRLWLFLVFVVCTVLYYVLVAFQPSSKPIVLSSDRIDLGAGGQRVITPFFVRNRGGIDLYQVVIKLLVESQALSVTNNDIRIDPLEVPATAEIPVPVQGDPFSQGLIAPRGAILPGRDLKGQEGLWLVIERLPPGTAAGFRIRNQSFKTLPPGRHYLSTSVAYFSNQSPSYPVSGDGTPTQWFPRSDLMELGSLGPGNVQVFFTGRVGEYDGANAVSNAQSLFEAGDWDRAEKELTRAIVENPMLGVAYCNRATLLWMRRRPEEGLNDASKAIALLPNDPLPHAAAANCLRLLGRKNEAIVSFTKAVTLAGTNMPSLTYERGVFLAELDRHAEARSAFTDSIRLGYTNEWPHYSRGVSYLKENLFSNAVEDLSIAIAKRPDMADAYLARHVAFRSLGNHDLANRDAVECMRLNPALSKGFIFIKPSGQVPAGDVLKAVPEK